MSLFADPAVDSILRKVEQLRTLAKDECATVAEICHTLGVFRATFYRYIN